MIYGSFYQIEIEGKQKQGKREEKKQEEEGKERSNYYHKHVKNIVRVVDRLNDNGI